MTSSGILCAAKKKRTSFTFIPRIPFLIVPHFSCDGGGAAATRAQRFPLGEKHGGEADPRLLVKSGSEAPRSWPSVSTPAAEGPCCCLGISSTLPQKGGIPPCLAACPLITPRPAVSDLKPAVTQKNGLVDLKALGFDLPFPLRGRLPWSCKATGGCTTPDQLECFYLLRNLRGACKLWG